MTASPLFDLLCSGCHAAYPDEGFPAVCPACGEPWESSGLRWHEPQAEATGLRRWAGSFGLSPEELPERAISRPPKRLGNVWIAQQGSSPSGSYKELGAEVMASAARHRGIGELFLDSSGNAGIAVARACSERGIRCTVLVPEHTPEVKLERSRSWGATVEVIPGDRDATHRAAEEWSRRMTYAAPFFQPGFAMGVATLAWELFLAFDGNLPRHWLLPAGNGPLLLGLGLGLEVLRRAERIDRLPALHAVQLEGYASLHPEGPGIAAAGAPRAAGIAIGNPPRRAAMRALVERTGGDVTRVSDEQIAAARQTLAEAADAGWHADPTGAAAYAGWLARPDLQNEPCVVIVSSREEPREETA
ncbi:MAG TPA: pyridoxal-phosphate dependent enzyme [Thermoanaerobaculia bacterium]|jgi:threonine synthase